MDPPEESHFVLDTVIILVVKIRVGVTPMFYFSGCTACTPAPDPELWILGTSSVVDKGQQLPCTCISSQPSADELEAIRRWIFCTSS